MPDHTPRGKITGAAICFLCFALVSPVFPAWSQDVDCANAIAQVEMTYCAERDWQRADVELNDAYRAASAKMDDIDAELHDDPLGAKKALKLAQRAWITYRDAACVADGFQMRGGTGEQMVVMGCMARLTEERTAHLWALSENY